MFELAVKRNIRGWIETPPTKDADKTNLDMKKRHRDVSLLSRQREKYLGNKSIHTDLFTCIIKYSRMYLRIGCKVVT